MPGDEQEIKWIRVRYGRRIFRARRFETGSWWIEDENGFHVTTVNNNDFQSQYEEVPDGA